ncbi:LTA synthase family protein [Mesorhizobium sp. CAU 1732]|uniref:LTA synthase family protein n=1 Tax=Mesorhizobium sp. CAU 1732 TaxID=3140358 RepID=UPI00326034F7
MNDLAVASTTVVKTGNVAQSEARSVDRWFRAPVLYIAVMVTASALIVFLAECVLRGSVGQATAFMVDISRPGLTTVALLSLAMIAIDALMRRSFQAILVVAPIIIALAWVGREKAFYLGDPPYPTDFLYARQIVELLPLMLVERPLTAVLIVLAALLLGGALFLLWRWSKRLQRITLSGRAARLAISIPALAFFAAEMDYASHSNLRDSLKISPMMWDQKANYRHNGLVMAFALNVPMAYVAPPVGYAASTMNRIDTPVSGTYVPYTQPDIIMVMSESFWDPTRLPGVTLTPDPIAFTRSIQSGHVFSPEFGGMTANVEFEALTGFSNALLPYGSIPYQQYVRRDTPSLASFLKEEGYSTLAVHPFQSWFWNRGPVYKSFGFDRFVSEENMPALDKRGRLASDAALTELIIEEVEASTDPMFLFAVTLQNHGPYEAGRYPDERIEVESKALPAARAAIHTFSEGMMDSDQSLERLIKWAEKRERETIVVYFGDHLPPLGPTYVATGFLERNVGDRIAGAERLREQRETPLVMWSNRRGQIDIGTVSPSLLPFHLLRTAGMEHPYYTGFLGSLRDHYRVIDRHIVIRPSGYGVEGWTRQKRIDPLLRDYRMIQYDMMFGEQHARDKFFPDPSTPALIARPGGQFSSPAPL